MSKERFSQMNLNFVLGRFLCFQLLLCLLIMSAPPSQSETPLKKHGLEPAPSVQNTICLEIKFDLNSAIFDPYDSVPAGHELAVDYPIRKVSKRPAIIIGFRDESEPVGISVTRANELKENFVDCFRVDPEVIAIRNYGATCPRSDEKTRNARALVCMADAGKTVEGVEAFLKCSPGSTPKLLTEAPAIVREEPPPLAEEGIHPCPEERNRRRPKRRRPTDDGASPTTPPPTRPRPGF